MYFILILFFASLFGIAFMFAKKLMLLQNGELVPHYEHSVRISHLEDWKKDTIKNIKKYIYFGLVAVIRAYVRTSNFAKNKYNEFVIKIKEIQKNRSKNTKDINQEVPKFLKIVSEYKEKIRAIKHRINEEENLQ